MLYDVPFGWRMFAYSLLELFPPWAVLDFFFFFLQSLQVGRGEGSDLYFTGFLFCFFLQSLQVEGKAQIYTSVCSALISSTANPPVL